MDLNTDEDSKKLMQINSRILSMIISAAVLMIVIDYSITASLDYAPVYAILGLLSLTLIYFFHFLLKTLHSQEEGACFDNEIPTAFQQKSISFNDKNSA